jgi:protein-disulfide isomerase
LFIQTLSFLSLLFTCAISALIADQPGENHVPNQSKIDISQQPTIGYPKATVQVVAFLEPKCPDSKRYNNLVYPKFEEAFINTNKVRYTVIPVSFLPHSMPAAIALLCVYNQDPQYPNNDLFFNYLNYIYHNQPPERENWATVENLQKFAAATSPAIQADRLKDCILNEKYRVQIEKNSAYGNKLMEGHLSTPTIFVDGVKVENTDDTINWDNLKKAIEQALQKRA